jgi:hypothetical protein
MLVGSTRGLASKLREDDAAAAAAAVGITAAAPTASSKNPDLPAALPKKKHPLPSLPPNAQQGLLELMQPTKRSKTSNIKKEEALDEVIGRALVVSGAALEGRSLEALRRAAGILGSEEVMGPSGRWRWTRKHGKDGEEQLMEVSYVLQVLHARVLPAATGEKEEEEEDEEEEEGTAVVEGGVRLTASMLCQLCQMHWLATDEEGLGARCQGLIWELLLLRPAGAAGGGGGGSSSKLRLALLAQVLETFSVDELEPLVRRIFKEAGKANLAGDDGTMGGFASLDVYVALCLLQRWFCRPGQSPMVSELGLTPGTLQGLAAAAAAAVSSSTLTTTRFKGAGKVSGGGHQPLLLSGGATSCLGPVEAMALLKLISQGLALVGSSGKSSSSSISRSRPGHLSLFHESIAALCLHLSGRHAAFRRQLLLHLLSLLSKGGKIDADRSSTGATTTTPSPQEAYLFHRLYMAFPIDTATILREERVDASLVIRVLRQGECLLRRPCSTVVEQRMPDDVAQLCRLGLDRQRDNEAMHRLNELAHWHPYLVLRQMPVLTEILIADASPASVRPCIHAPFYFPSSSSSSAGPSSHHAKHPPFLPPVSSACGGGDIFLASFATTPAAAVAAAAATGTATSAPPNGSTPTAAAVESRLPQRIRTTFWGLAFRPDLWRAILDLVMKVPAECMAAYVTGASFEATRRLEEVMGLCALYIKLLTAQRRVDPPSPPPPPAAAAAPPTPTTTKMTAKQKKQQLQQQQLEEEQRLLAPPLAFLASNQMAPEMGVLSGEETSGFLVYMAERLLTLLQELEKYHPQTILSFLQTPDPTMGNEVRPFDVMRQTLEQRQHLPPPPPPPQPQQQQQQQQQQEGVPLPSLSLPPPRRIGFN